MNVLSGSAEAGSAEPTELKEYVEGLEGEGGEEIEGVGLERENMRFHSHTRIHTRAYTHAHHA